MNWFGWLSPLLTALSTWRPMPGIAPDHRLGVAVQIVVAVVGLAVGAWMVVQGLARK